MVNGAPIRRTLKLNASEMFLLVCPRTYTCTSFTRAHARYFAVKELKVRVTIYCFRRSLELFQMRSATQILKRAAIAKSFFTRRFAHSRLRGKACSAVARTSIYTPLYGTRPMKNSYHADSRERTHRRVDSLESIKFVVRNIRKRASARRNAFR